MQIQPNNEPKKLIVEKPPIGAEPQIQPEVQQPIEPEGAVISNIAQEGTKIEEPADLNQMQQQSDIQAMQRGLATAEIEELPEERLAARPSAWSARQILKMVRKEVEKEEKTFKVGDTAPIESKEPYEEIELEEAKGLVGQKLENFKTEELWQTNFNKLENADDVNGLIAAVSENLKGEIMEARGGIRKDEEIIALAKDLNTDPEFVAEFVSSPDSHFVEPEKILAARQVLNNSAAYLHDLAVLVTADKATPEQQLLFKKQYAFHQQFMKQFMAKRANVGRALRAYGLPTGAGDAQSDHIQQMLMKVHGGLDLKKAAEQIATAPNATAVHGVVDAQDSLMRKLGNVFIENFINSILSGVKTHIVNTTGSAMMIAMHSFDTAVAARLGTRLDDTAMRVDRDEWKAGLFAMLNGTHDAFATMKQVMKTAEAYGGATKIENTARAYISAEYLNLTGRTGTIVDGLGHIIRAPTERLMGGIDGFMKVIAERQQLAQVAYRIANAEAEANKWTQKETLDRLEELIQNPTDEMINEATNNALRVTFQSPLGDWGQNIQKAAGSNPFTQYFMPFVKTPINLMKQGFLERTPLALVTKQYQNELAAGGARAQMARARMYIGSSFILAAAGFAAAGKITGAGSNNHKVRSAQLESGWRPYSFVFEDDNGTRTYVSYQRTEPFSYIFATVADFYETMKITPTVGEDDQRYGERLTSALIIATSHATLDRTFMTGMADAMDLMNDPQPSKVGSWVKRTLQAQVPYSGLRRDATRVFDDSKKTTDTFLEELQKNTPYFNKDLPDMLDSLGQPVRYDAVMNPLPIVSKKRNAIFDEAARLGLAINKNPLAVPDKMIEGIRLTAQQYHDLIKLSRDEAYSRKNLKLADALTEMLQNKNYQEATDDQKYEVFKDIVSTYDAAGRTMLFKQDKDLFMRIQARSNAQAADALAKKTGEDKESLFLRLKEKTSRAYDRAF